MQRLTKWLTVMLLVIPTLAPAQLTLDRAYEMAKANYPLIRQRDLISKTASLNIENLQKSYLPQVSLLAQATYQSDVTEIKVPGPGIFIEPLNKDQYKIVADVNQVIYDGGVTKEQKIIQELNAHVEQQKLEVELYKLKERISQVFLSVLFFDEQLKQVELVKADLNTGIRRVQAQVDNGVAFRSNLSLLQAELLKTDQRAIELQASREGLIRTLGLFINQELSPTIALQIPVVEVVTDTLISRPELQLYTSQDRLLERQTRIINSKNLPRASLFVQGGYARPGLNLFINDFDFYYLGGVRLNWSLSGLYTKKREQELIEVNRSVVGTQKETFLLNTKTSMVQQDAEITKMQKLLATDDEIIGLRVRVKDAAKAQLDNGVITANDYLREVNAEDQARQTKIAHQLQLLQARINYKNISGKL